MLVISGYICMLLLNQIIGWSIFIKQLRSATLHIFLSNDTYVNKFWLLIENLLVEKRLQLIVNKVVYANVLVIEFNLLLNSTSGLFVLL